MRTAKTKAKTKRAPKKPIEKPQRVLDEETSAHVVAEYLALEDVKGHEIEKIESSTHTLSYREIAITFRMSEVLGIRDCFKITPRFETAFKIARALFAALKKVSIEPAEVTL